MPQARNLMRRAINEIIDPGPVSVDPLWEYFGARCAYCGRALVLGARDAHAERDGGNHIGNPVLACSTCNGDEKRRNRGVTFCAESVPTMTCSASASVEFSTGSPFIRGHRDSTVSRLRSCASGVRRWSMSSESPAATSRRQ